VKITDDVRVVEASYKARKMVRVTMEIASNRVRDVLLSGDFFMISEDMLPKLEAELVGAPLNRRELSQRLRRFYERTRIQAPGVMPEDFVEAIMKAAET